MVLIHRVCARRNRTLRPYCITSSLTNCFTMWAMAELSHLGIGVRKKREWRKGREGLRRSEFSHDSAAICMWEEAILFHVKSQKCPYHMTFDLELDLQHTLGAGPPGDHCVQVWWWSSHLSGRSDLRKCLQTDVRADGRTTHAARWHNS